MKPDWGTEMLILTRKMGESIVINQNIYVTILGINGNQIRLGIDAPTAIPVHREEIHLKIQEQEDSPENYQPAYLFSDKQETPVFN